MLMLTPPQAEAQAALAAAEAERNNRAEAQGMSEALRQESERRARVFNNAVKAAVSKVQKDLQVWGRLGGGGCMRCCHALLPCAAAQLSSACRKWVLAAGGCSDGGARR
jgi:hypothetical protein